MEIIDMMITHSNPVERAALIAGEGPVAITGIIEAHFASDDLARFFQQAQVQHENHILRLIRPHMPKRAFLRMRGRVKARRRKALP